MCRSIISSRSTSLVVIEMIFHLRLLESSSMFASPLYWSPRYSPMILNIQILNEKKSFRVTTSKDLRLKPALSDSILLLFNFSFGWIELLRSEKWKGTKNTRKRLKVTVGFTSGLLVVFVRSKYLMFAGIAERYMLMTFIVRFPQTLERCTYMNNNSRRNYFYAWF